MLNQITVSGNYIPSSFASSIDVLVETFKPLAENVETDTLIDVVGFLLNTSLIK
jgi:hypothetical protein